MFSDNKFKASIAVCYYDVSYKKIFSFLLHNHIVLNHILDLISSEICDITTCCFGHIAVLIRLKLSMICLLTRL